MPACCHCRRDRPEGELVPALDMHWREIAGKVYCRDKEACISARMADDQRRQDALRAVLGRPPTWQETQAALEAP